MTIEIGTTSPPATAEDLSATRQALFEALRAGDRGVPLLRAMLKNAKLSPEQQAFVDVLFELEDQRSAAGHDQPDEDSPAGRVSVDHHKLEELKQELSDLREANDTVAAALGACPYCWGGDRHCEVCLGRGRPGFRPPDPDLFGELVLPAVTRARALARAGPRPRSRVGRA